MIFQRQAFIRYGIDQEYTSQMARELIYWFVPMLLFFGSMGYMVVHPPPGGFIFFAGIMVHPVPSLMIAYLIKKGDRLILRQKVQF